MICKATPVPPFHLLAKNDSMRRQCSPLPSGTVNPPCASQLPKSCCALQLLAALDVADAALPEVKELQLPVRVLHLPLAFEDQWTRSNIQRCATGQQPVELSPCLVVQLVPRQYR